MKIVQPIREAMWVDEFIRYFEQTSPRNHLLFLLGIYTGFRIGDLLKLRVRDVSDSTHITITEQKTGKTRRVIIHDKLRLPLRRYIENKARTDYLFESRQKSKSGKKKPLDRSTVDKILKQAAQALGYKEPIATHSLRKTFGYRYYNASGGDIAALMKFYNHTSQEITIRYVGLEQDTFDAYLQRI